MGGRGFGGGFSPHGCRTALRVHPNLVRPSCWPDRCSHRLRAGLSQVSPGCSSRFARLPPPRMSQDFVLGTLMKFGWADLGRINYTYSIVCRSDSCLAPITVQGVLTYTITSVRQGPPSLVVPATAPSIQLPFMPHRSGCAATAGLTCVGNWRGDMVKVRSLPVSHGVLVHGYPACACVTCILKGASLSRCRNL